MMARLFSSVWKHPGDKLFIGGLEYLVDVELALPFCSLLGKYVPGMRMPPFDLAGRGNAKPFRRALMCFEFWHFSLLVTSSWEQIW